MFFIYLCANNTNVAMKLIAPFLCLAMVLSACTGMNKPSATEAPAVSADTLTTLSEPELPLLVGDSLLNRAARFYAGISHDGIDMSVAERGQWESHARRMESAMTSSRKTTDPMDTLMSHDMTDLRERCDYVFYPFSGPDFLYPITLFPNADTYFLAGLEWTGSPLTEIVSDSDHFHRYTSALDVYMRSSFFRTKSMDKDLDNDAIDGTVPVISMLMALRGYEVIGVEYKVLTPEGALRDTTALTNLAAIRFFHPSTPRHEQILYYLSGDLSDSKYDERVGLYMQQTLTQHYTVTFFKAASYLLHQSFFSKMRQNILLYTDAIIGDDSGMPYRYLKDDFDVTLYGKYQRPIKLFGDHDYQRDLQTLYDSIEVRPLPFRIGYNRISNWMVARKKQ